MWSDSVGTVFREPYGAWPRKSHGGGRGRIDSTGPEVPEPPGVTLRWSSAMNGEKPTVDSR